MRDLPDLLMILKLLRTESLSRKIPLKIVDQSASLANYHPFKAQLHILNPFRILQRME